jgi:DNA primase
MNRSFLQLLKTRLSLPELVSRFVKLERRGKDLWGCCPFHKEKTPSFKVNDTHSGFYCFGCGAHGDAIAFYMRLKNLSFREAVEELAQGVGLDVPDETSDPQQLANRKTLQENGKIMGRISLWLESQLSGSGGRQARNYLEGRGITRGACKTFTLGWAPPSRIRDQPTITEHWMQCGLSSLKLRELGLWVDRKRGRGGDSERFEDRIMFPIMDSHGSIVGFGGRTLGKHKAKYLNSPETDYFKKSDHLYGLWQARQNIALRDAPVVLTEGYLDVISLQSLGGMRGVSPMGTSLSEAQLMRVWTLSPKAYVCFDGDQAGQDAMVRLARFSLTHTRPGHSLSFVFLPEGEDPHSLLTSGQGDVFKACFKRTRSVVDVLWQSACQEIGTQTPEEKAALKKHLAVLSGEIAHQDVRIFYRQAFDQLFYQAFFSRRKDRSPAKSQPLRVITAPLTDHLQQQVILWTLFKCPYLLGDLDEALLRLDLSSPYDTLLACFIRWWEHEGESLDKDATDDAKLRQSLYLFVEGDDTLRSFLDSFLGSNLSVHAPFTHDLDRDKVCIGFQDVLANFQKRSTLSQEVKSAEEMFAQDMHEDTWRRLKKMRELYVCGNEYK